MSDRVDIVAPPSADSLESCRLRARLKQQLFRRPPAATRLGRYQLGALLGVGGMGRVYEAHDPVLDRRVAIKVMSAAPTARSARRLRREGRALAALCHENIVPVFEIGLADARPYVVMELVDGAPLDVWARQGTPTFASKVDAIVQAARGLAAAHAVGIVHCDVKPGNVLVGRDGRVRVADFGLASNPHGHSTATTLSSDPSEQRSLTGVGGTPGYIAPERLTGARADTASDQFALCVTAVEILWSERPRGWGGAPSAARGRVQTRIARVLQRGLARDPRKRYADLHGLIDALTRARRPARARTFIAAGALAMAAVPWSSSASRPPAPPPEDREPTAAPDPRRAELEQRIAAAEHSRHLGRYAEAYATSMLAAHDAALWGHPDLVPAAWVELGLVAAFERRGDVAQSLLQDAYVEASRWGDDEAVARAAAAMRLAASLEDDDSARIWTRYASAVAARAGDPSLSPAPRRSRIVVGAFGRDEDLAQDEAWVFEHPHAGTPACSGHGCAHDLGVLHRGREAWVPDAQAGRGRPVYALTAGEVIACWRGYPDHAVSGESARGCWCHRSTGESRCDASDSPPSPEWASCPEVVRGGGNVLVVLDDNGVGLNYVHLEAGSSPPHLCPNDRGRPIPEDFASREGFFPREYLTRPDASVPRPRVEVGDLIGRTGQSGWAETPRVHIQAVAYEALDDGNFGQLELLELQLTAGCAAPLSTMDWTPLREPTSLNELWLEHGPIALRPSCPRAVE